MENLNQLKDLLNQPTFSEERYKYFRDAGLSEEEIQVLERAEAASNLTDILPSDEAGIQAIYDKIEALPENPGMALDKLHEMAENDPESYAQILALVEALDMAHEKD